MHWKISSKLILKEMLSSLALKNSLILRKFVDVSTSTLSNNKMRMSSISKIYLLQGYVNSVNSLFDSQKQNDSSVNILHRMLHNSKAPD